MLYLQTFSQSQIDLSEDDDDEKPLPDLETATEPLVSYFLCPIYVSKVYNCPVVWFFNYDLRFIEIIMADL